MALKDWKKGRNMKDGSVQFYYQGSNYNFISIRPYKKHFDNVEEWSVDTRFNSKKFKKKSQAIAFAKKYMGSH